MVSGGALGVDITASIAAMPNTIGIFANGLDQIIQELMKKSLNKFMKML